MHSPNASGPSMTMRRPECYGAGPSAPSYSSPTTGTAEPGPGGAVREPSTKILQSLLYNIAHSGYLAAPTSPETGDRTLAYTNGSGGPVRAPGGRHVDPDRNIASRVRDCPSSSSSSSSTSHSADLPPLSRGRGVCRDVTPPSTHSHRPHPYRLTPPSHSPGQAAHDLATRNCYNNHHQPPSATVTVSQSRAARGEGTQPGSYPDSYLSPRHRSSSIGSAGSSFRDSRSPSHDSTVSHDSLSRCSPLSVSSSPSPSPPQPLERSSSKLLGILKGASYSYPYGVAPSMTAAKSPHHSDSSMTGPSVTRPHRRSSSNSEHSSSKHSSSHHSSPLHSSSPYNARGVPGTAVSKDSKSPYSRPGNSCSRKKGIPVPPPLMPLQGLDYTGRLSIRTVDNGSVSSEVGQDEPMDLSFKPRLTRAESLTSPGLVGRLSGTSTPRRTPLAWGEGYYVPSTSSDDGEADSGPKKSILESILCAHKPQQQRPNSRSAASVSSPSLRASPALSLGQPSRPGSANDSRNSIVTSPLLTNGIHGSSGTTSPTSLTPSPLPNSSQSPMCSAPPSPGSSPTLSSPAAVASPFAISSPPPPSTPRCPWRQQVTLAKKTLYPVRARVSDWFTRIARFAKSRPEFLSLSDGDKVTLLQHAWTRLLLLYMAENNFHFAVTPVHEDGAADDGGRPPAISGIDPSEPTMDSVEMVQNFIRKCQALAVEGEEYTYLRVITLFHAGCSGLEDGEFVERISSGARLSLQNHVNSSSVSSSWRADDQPDKLRYPNLLLCVHTLFGLNCGMVQTLFCQHLAKDSGLDAEVRNLVLRQDSAKEDSDNNKDPAEGI